MTKETAEKHAIRDYLRLNGWFVYHNLAGLGCYAGLADLTALRNGVVVQIEVKTPKGKQSDKQIIFAKEWKDRGGYYVIGDFEIVKSFVEVFYGKN
jgi:Holliday junction resolvase